MNKVFSRVAYLFAISLSLNMSFCLAEQGHLHHVGLNVVDPDNSKQFYEKVFGAVPISFNDTIPALFTERSFILLNQTEKQAFSNLKTAIWHIGWGGVDGPNEYKWWLDQGVEFYTPVTELGRNHYMYLYGPDREIIEIYTGNKNHRFNHVHILASEPLKTTEWIQKNLKLEDSQVRKGEDRSFINIDNVQIIVYPNIDRYRPKEQGSAILPTDDSAVSHISFSFRDLTAAYQHFVDNKAEIVSPIKVNDKHGLRSFFTRAPDGILVEIVEAKPLPQGIWE